MTIGNSKERRIGYASKEAMEQIQANSSVPHGVAGAPNESALLSLMERTGYSMIQENGQRKYGGPPPGWEGSAPLRGCEIFVGKIPRDCFEDELVPVFERIGRIYELRLMMDFSGSNRGYCFVMYTKREDAKRACLELNNFEIRKGRFLGVCLSVDNCRLFVGGIPKNKQRDEILAEMTKVTDGVVDVIVYPSATDKTKNRGFAFVEYESHRAAAMARRKLIPGRIQLWGHQIAVDWAEPEQDCDEEVMSKVKVLYVRNLMLSTTEETLEVTFNRAVNKEAAVERVKKIRDYAFIHFTERDDALKAMQVLNGSNLDGAYVEVTLAKPVDKNEQLQRNAQTNATLSTPLPRTTAFPLQPDLSAALYNPYAATALYPGLYQYAYPAAAAAAYGGPAAAAALTNPQPAAPPRTGGRGLRGRGSAGSRGAGGTRVPGRTYGNTRAAPRKHAADVLEEHCASRGWSSPTYSLLSTRHPEDADVPLYVFKVSIPSLQTQYQPTKLCRTIDDAKNFAADYVLVQLGLPSVDAMTGAVIQQPALMTAPEARPGSPGSLAATMGAGGDGPAATTTSLNQAALAQNAALYTGRPAYAMSNGVASPAAADAASMAAMSGLMTSPYVSTAAPPAGVKMSNLQTAPNAAALALQGYPTAFSMPNGFGQYTA